MLQGDVDRIVRNASERITEIQPSEETVFPNSFTVRYYRLKREGMLMTAFGADKRAVSSLYRQDINAIGLKLLGSLLSPFL